MKYLSLMFKGFLIWMAAFAFVLEETQYFQIKYGYHKWATTKEEWVCDVIGLVASYTGVIIIIINGIRLVRNK